MPDSFPTNAYAAPQSSLAADEPRPALPQGYPPNTGLNWFFWIACLSIINSVVALFDAPFSFALGLFITFFVDSVGREAAGADGGAMAMGARVVAFTISIGLASFFILFGLLGRRLRQWAILLGIGLFLLDTLLLLAMTLFMDQPVWMGLLIHVWALFALFGGWRQARIDLNARQAAMFHVPAIQ